MSTNRMTRVNELLRREVAVCLYRMMDGSEIDLAVVTIVRVETSPDLRHAHIYVSVRGDEDVQKQVMRALARKRKAVQQEVSKHVVLKYTPHYQFQLDRSVAEGDRVLSILSEITDGPVEPEDETLESEEAPD